MNFMSFCYESVSNDKEAHCTMFDTMKNHDTHAQWCFQWEGIKDPYKPSWKIWLASANPMVHVTFQIHDAALTPQQKNNNDDIILHDNMMPPHVHVGAMYTTENGKCCWWQRWQVLKSGMDDVMQKCKQNGWFCSIGCLYKCCLLWFEKLH